MINPSNGNWFCDCTDDLQLLFTIKKEIYIYKDVKIKCISVVQNTNNLKHCQIQSKFSISDMFDFLFGSITH